MATQVSFRTPAGRQSFTVEVCVIDKNDNVPTFIGESMRGSVQLGLLKGERTSSAAVCLVIKIKQGFIRGEIPPTNLGNMLFTLLVLIIGFVTPACVSGIPFMQVEALDRDDRGSINGELRFSLLEQTPRIPSSQMFSIDSITGEVSLTEEGRPITVTS